MTEGEWLECTDPDAMLEFLRDRASDRKLRLFACACCRRLLPLLKGKRQAALRVCEKALGGSERYADGLATEDELRGVLSNDDIYSVRSGPAILAVEVARRTLHGQFAGNERPMRFGRALIGHPASEAAEFARGVVSSIARDSSDRNGKSPTARKRAATIHEKASQVALLRDLFGNPFRPLPPRNGKKASAARLGRWVAFRGGVVHHLAASTYDRQEFDQLPILADALEEAGCTDAAVLDHCRGTAPHARGCWLLDLLLGRS